jgi:hypothetical protein
LGKVDIETKTMAMMGTSKPFVLWCSKWHAAHIAKEKNTKILAGREMKGCFSPLFFFSGGNCH